MQNTQNSTEAPGELTVLTSLAALRKTYKSLLTTVKTLESKLILFNETMEQFEKTYHGEKLKKLSKKVRSSTKRAIQKPSKVNTLETPNLQDLEKLFEVETPEAELY